MCTGVYDSTEVPSNAEVLAGEDPDSDSTDTEGAIRDEFDRKALRFIVCNYVVASVLRSDTDFDV